MKYTRVNDYINRTINEMNRGKYGYIPEENGDFDDYVVSMFGPFDDEPEPVKKQEYVVTDKRDLVDCCERYIKGKEDAKNHEGKKSPACPYYNAGWEQATKEKELDEYREFEFNPEDQYMRYIPEEEKEEQKTDTNDYPYEVPDGYREFLTNEFGWLEYYLKYPEPNCGISSIIDDLCLFVPTTEDVHTLTKRMSIIIGKNLDGLEKVWEDRGAFENWKLRKAYADTLRLIVREEIGY